MIVRRIVGSRRRFTLLLLVYGASLMLVILTGVALVGLVSEHVTNTAIDSSVSSDRSLVHAFVVANLLPEDMREALDAARLSEIERDLGALIDPKGIVQVKVYSIDGSIMFSNLPELRGLPAADDDELARAISSRQPVATVIHSAGTEAAARHLHEQIHRPNLMVKIPATAEGVPAIQAMVAEGRNISRCGKCDNGIFQILHGRVHEAAPNTRAKIVFTCLV